MSKRALRVFTLGCVALLVIAYGAIWALAPIDAGALGRIWWCAPIGVFGALIANSTGTGGGVVFVPVFNVLHAEALTPIAPEGIVGASFLIQCFGMSVGSLTWLNRLYDARNRGELDLPRGAKLRIMGLVLVCSTPALLIAQRSLHLEPGQVLVYFKGFSIALGTALLASAVLWHGRSQPRTALSAVDAAVLAPLSIAGGLATAAFSVGVGEFVALYLLVRGYPMRATIASAVMISAITVLIGAPYHIAHTPLAWEVIALAAPGVVVGGFLARRLAYLMGERRLKIAASLWIIGSSLYLIAR
ncbi:MAG: sulfite exporter TauE/SafE family protein [Caulobacterales bacterium]|nr:sulfite exporter TauE/SafE family protein [Caulobacterales bacterium]